jgi:hypothetical protein
MAAGIMAGLEGPEAAAHRAADSAAARRAAGHHGGNRDTTNPDQMFENLDTNHDGVLSRDEFAAMAHGGASNKDAGNGNYHSSNPHPSNNSQSQSQNTSSGDQSAVQN